MHSFVNPITTSASSTKHESEDLDIMDEVDGADIAHAQDSMREQSGLSELLSPVELPCGRILPNRLAKAAMYEHLASFFGGPPNPAHHELYTIWARGGWGMIITGNVQVSRVHLSLGADMIVPMNLSEDSVEPFRRLADCMKGRGDLRSDACEENMRPIAIMQLNHTGRQSFRLLGGRWPFQPPLSASATRVGESSESRRNHNLLTRLLNAVLFQRARAMEERHIREVIDGFVRGARLAYECGFDGVQIHAAHGYLVAQFVSRKTNLRTDKYAAPLAFLHNIAQAIRSVVPRDFIVGVKVNAADYITGGLTEADGAEHLADIGMWRWDGAGIDFIEISGGDYETPEFMQKSSPRQAFFESFSRVAVKAVEQGMVDSTLSRKPPLIMLTGGLRTRAQFSRVIDRGHAHILGIARLSILQPALPNLLRTYNEQAKARGWDNVDKVCKANDEQWYWESEPPPEPSSPQWWPRLVGASVGVAWYVVAMRRLTMARKLPYGKYWILLVLEMYFGILQDRWTGWILLGMAVAVVIMALS